MALTVDYHPHGCSGRFAERVRLPPSPTGIAITLAAVSALVIAWAMGVPKEATFGLGLGLAVILFHLASLQARTRQEAEVVSTFDVVGPWLEVHRGERTDRVYLPDAKVVLSGHTIHVRCTLSATDTVIVGVHGDEDALQHLVVALTQVEAPTQGDQSEIPPALRRITESNP